MGFSDMQLKAELNDTYKEVEGGYQGELFFLKKYCNKREIKFNLTMSRLNKKNGWFKYAARRAAKAEMLKKIPHSTFNLCSGDNFTVADKLLTAPSIEEFNQMEMAI